MAFACEPVVASLANILRPDVVDQQAVTAKVPSRAFNLSSAVETSCDSNAQFTLPARHDKTVLSV